ncbi:MAG TPA: dihydrofolate reductase family protein [Vicinamibacterales bacterium]|jgi:riboflavin biosynthesis pyrimidine reductase
MAEHGEKFARFAARKTQEATEAVLPPYTTVVDTAPRDVLAIGNSWSRRLFDGGFYHSIPDPDRVACSLVFVQSRSGNTGARNPSELGGGETDKHLIYEGLSRVPADAVLAGAGTVRGGQLVFSVWHPELVSLRTAMGLPRHPVQIIATLQGLDVRDMLIFNVPEVPVVLLTVGACARLMKSEIDARPWISVVEMPAADALPHAFDQLRGRGIRRVSAVGGRKLAAQLIDAGLVQDVYLTTSPNEGGEPNTPLYPRSLPGRVVVRKHGSGREAGVVFEQTVLRSGT